MGYYLRFRGAIPQIGGDTYVLLSRPPLTCSLAETSSLDLHISGTPPTFILSQDQTLKKKLGPPIRRAPNPFTRLNCQSAR